MKLSDYVFKFISGTGVRHVFMLPGGGAMHLVDSLGRAPHLEFVCNLHEQACAVAAAAYSQYTNNLGVALVTTGPGGTNAVTGVAGAWCDSVPCLFLSGQVKRSDLKEGRGVRQMGFQEIDIVGIVSPITKYAVTVKDPQSIRFHLEKAIHLSKSGRPGPVWLDIPLDVQSAEIEEECLVGFVPEITTGDGAPLAEAARKTAKLLREARRPVILAGNGIRLSGAGEIFLRLCDRLQVPLLASWKAADFLPENHPLYVGRPGVSGQRGANFALQGADLVLSIGARLDHGQIGYETDMLAPGAKKIIVDIDEYEAGKLAGLELAVCADAGEFIGALDRSLADAERGQWTAWLEHCKGLQAKYPVVPGEYWKQTRGVNNYVLLDVLSEEMSADDVLAPGSSGASSEITMQAFRVKRGQRVLNFQGLGPMGFGLATAIGACLAGEGRRTVCIDGDGGIAMNPQELETIKRLNLPVKVFVLNNQGYGSIRGTQRAHFEGRLVASDATSGLTLPPITKVAEAFGVRTRVIKDHSRIREEVREVLSSTGPFLCEVLISPDQVAAPRVTSFRTADGSIKSKPLHDMWPFLSESEILGNLSVPKERGGAAASA